MTEDDDLAIWRVVMTRIVYDLRTKTYIDLAQAEAELAARMAQAEAELAARGMLNSAELETLGELNEREQQVLRLRFGRGGGGADAAGVREPRRPLPTAGAGNVQIDLDPDN